MRRVAVLALMASLGVLAASAAAGEWAAHARGASPAVQSLVPPGSEIRSHAWLGSEALRGARHDTHLVLVEPRLGSEALESVAGFARGGGTVWVLATSPASLPGSAAPAGVLPGAIVADGEGPRHVLQDGAVVQLAGTRALTESASCATIARADASSYRDANGDGRVSVGEPSGPFSVACASEAGSGAFVILAMSARQPLPAELIDALGSRRSPGEWRVVDGSSRPAWDPHGGFVGHAVGEASLGKPQPFAAIGALLLAGVLAILGPAAIVRVRSLLPRRNAPEAGD